MILNALSAKNLTYSNRVKENPEKYIFREEEISKEIEHATTSGELYCQIPFSLNEYEVFLLNALGYKVITKRDFGMSDLIKWDHI